MLYRVRGAVQSSTLQCAANQKFAIQWSSMQFSELNCCELKLHIFFITFQWSALHRKLDRVGPVDNRPSTDKHHHKNKQTKKQNKKHVTHDMYHVTCDTWPVTCDMLWGVNNLSKFQLPSSYCLWFMILWRSGGKGSSTEWMDGSMN